MNKQCYAAISIFSVIYRFNSQEALEAAKANVEKHYAVVGVMEMWDETLEVLENTLPFFFSGTVTGQ